MDDASTPFLIAAKLRVPALRPETIRRAALEHRLERATQHRLTLLCAPAGFGKTTALVGWLTRSRRRVAWLTLDGRDNDPRRFAAHLLAACAEALPGAMDGAWRALRAGADLRGTVVPLAVAAIAEHAPDGLVVVLDDYHVLTEPDCHRIVIAALDDAPPSVRVAIASRTRPPLRLERRRAAGTLVELGPEQLRFTRDETQRFLNGTHGLGLERAQLDAVAARLDGWAAGLALAAATLADRIDRHGFLAAFARSTANVSEYLVEEVLAGTDPTLREFLYRTSILGRLSPPLCTAALDDPAAGALLVQARRANLFLSVLDEDGAWLGYDEPFAELLQGRLRERSPALAAQLHRRAADWLAANGFPDEAIEHAIAAGDGPGAARLLADHWRTLLDARRYVTVRNLIARLPADRGELGSFCDALDVLCLALNGADLRLVATRLDELERVRAAPGVGEIVDRLRVSPYYGDVRRSVADAWAVWRRWAGDRHMRARIAGQFGMLLWFAREPDAVHAVLGATIASIDRASARVWAHAALALTATDEGDLDAAEHHGRAAVALVADAGGEGSLDFHLAYVALGETLRLRGALAEADAALEHAARITATLPESLYHALVLVLQAQLSLAARDRRRARTRALAARRIVDRHRDVGVLAARLAAVEQSLDRRADDALLGSQPTPAEMRLLELLATDLTLRRIAEERLIVSIHTVTSHARRLYRRLGARTRAEAVAAARERGLI